MFYKLMKLSPVTLFRALSLLYIAEYGVFCYYGKVDAEKISVEDE